MKQLIVDNFVYFSIAVSILVLVAELISNYYSKYKDFISKKVAITAAVFAIASSIVTLYEKKESDLLKDKILNTENENLKLTKELKLLENSFVRENNKVKNITASLVAKLNVVFNKDNFPFQTLNYYSNAVGNELTLFPVQGKNVRPIELVMADQTTFSNHELNFSTFYTNYVLSATSSILNEDIKLLKSMSILNFFIPVENWYKINFGKIVVEKVDLKIKVNGKIVIAIDRPINASLDRAKYSNNMGRFEIKLEPKDFKL